MTARIDFEIPADAEQTKCRSCACPVVFITTTNGKSMPLDLNTVEERDGKRYAITHFATCPQRREWRKKS